MSDLHNTSRWQKLRRMWITMNPTCAACARLGRLSAAKVVDHIVPHRGDVDLFWNENNLMSLCSHCHNSIKQSHEKRGGVVGYGADGKPIDPNHHWNKDDDD